MTIGVVFTKWGLGLSIFGVLAAASTVTIALRALPRPESWWSENITLSVRLPVDIVGGLGAGRWPRHGSVGPSAADEARRAPTHHGNTGSTALWLCVVGLIGVFLAIRGNGDGYHVLRQFVLFVPLVPTTFV